MENNKITLETKIRRIPIRYISNIGWDMTMGELLKLSLDPNDQSGLYGIRNIGPVKAKEIIDKVHKLGFKFEYEDTPPVKEENESKEITLETKLCDTPIYHVNRFLGYMTIGELLKKTLDPKDRNSVYRIRNIGPIKAEKIISIIHELGFKFEYEDMPQIIEEKVTKKEEKIKPLTIKSSVYDLFDNSLLPRRMNEYGIKTIGDLLKLSTKKNIPYYERGIYNIKSLGDKKAEVLINYLHSMGFTFEDEKSTFSDVFTLENLFNSLDREFIFCEFYEKFNSQNDFANNYFVLYFTKLAISVCKSEYNAKYTNKEIVLFLLKKLEIYRKQMLMIANNIHKTLELTKK